MATGHTLATVSRAGMNVYLRISAQWRVSAMYDRVDMAMVGSFVAALVALYGALSWAL